MPPLLPLMFQSTPAHDGRRKGNPSGRCRLEVSIHARTRRATRSLPTNSSDDTSFQSTPAHDGRPGKVWRYRRLRNVSIHARTRRATSTRRPTRQRTYRFNPRPHTTGDAIMAGDASNNGLFQSTPAHDGRRPEPRGESSQRDVSIHARTRRATRCQACRGPLRSGFNPRPHTTGDRKRAFPVPATARFQSTPAHDGRRHVAAAVRRRHDCFNPRPHTAGDAMPQGNHDDGEGFNPRPHTAGDDRNGDRNGRILVVSIHARTRRATPARTSAATPTIWFQSTPAHGERHEHDSNHHCTRTVSIHARTRRATQATAGWQERRHCFNPRPHTAGDPSIRDDSQGVHKFQSTPAHGGRPRTSRRIVANGTFQSTPAHDGRQLEIAISNPRSVSIHARTRRATPTPPKSMPLTTRFNPRPHTAGDMPERICPLSANKFQSTPAHGGRRCSWLLFLSIQWFQSTPAHGGRPPATGLPMSR